MYRLISQEYGWTPSQINDLTLFQLAYYCGGITSEHGVVKLNAQQIQRVLQNGL